MFHDIHDSFETTKISFSERTNGISHIYLPDGKPGQFCGYRMHGPYDPQAALRFNTNKLLLDPYAKPIGRDLRWEDALFGYTVGDEKEDLSFDTRDCAPFAPLAEYELHQNLMHLQNQNNRQNTKLVPEATQSDDKWLTPIQFPAYFISKTDFFCLYSAALNPSSL